MFRVFLESDNGKSKNAHFVERPDTVMLLAKTEEGTFFLIKEHCPARNAYEYFLPKGKVEENEDLQVSAQRELQEEIGFNAKKIIPYGILNNDKMKTNTHLFLMESLTTSQLQGDELEMAEKRLVSFEEFEELVHSGEITDARSIACVYKILKQ